MLVLLIVDAKLHIPFEVLQGESHIAEAFLSSAMVYLSDHTCDVQCRIHAPCCFIQCTRGKVGQLHVIIIERVSTDIDACDILLLVEHGKFVPWLRLGHLRIGEYGFCHIAK